MDFSTILPNPWVWGLGLVVLLASACLLVSNQQQRRAVLKQLHFQKRRASGSKTPPRSLSPDKSKGEKAPLPSAEYADQFPPSRRSVLPQLAETISSPAKKKVLLGREPPKDFLMKSSLPMSRSYMVDNAESKYTPMGFSTEEIKAMGDFPAYDILTGVPLPKPYEGFDINKALPRPYRPFRWVYHQTMAYWKLEPDWWLELENTYVERIKQRKELFREHGNKVLDYLPGSELVCKELMEMSLQFLCARYPQYFSLSEDKTIFTNRILNEETQIKRLHPLHVLLNNVPEDYAIVLRNETDGLYYFRAGVICSSLGWNVSTKLGKNLAGIHKPIPDYKEKMSFSMDRFFSKMRADMPIQRGSWGLEIGQPLFMPPGHPHEKFREFQKEDLKVEECFLRVDWQTLRRLPLSGGIVFNYKAIFTPVPEFRDEPYIPDLLLKILREGKKNLMEYKSTWHVEHVCIPALESYAEEQKQKGWVKAENGGDEPWSVATLAEAPYFPGWEEKWHRQQGF